MTEEAEWLLHSDASNGCERQFGAATFFLATFWGAAFFAVAVFFVAAFFVESLSPLAADSCFWTFATVADTSSSISAREAVAMRSPSFF